jgi:hypothetical protein
VVLKVRREKRGGKPARSASQPKQRPNRHQIKQLSERRDAAAAEVEAAEKRIAELDEKFCEPGFFERTPHQEVQALQAEQKRLGGRVEELMAEWERLERELGELQG